MSISKISLQRLGSALVFGAIISMFSTSAAFAASGKGGGTPVPPPAPAATTTTTAIVFSGGTVFPSTVLAGSAPITETFALINTGTLPLSVNTISLLSQTNNPYSLNTAGAGLCSNGITLPTGTGTTLSPVGANVCLVKVTFNPTTIGGYSTTVNFAFQNAPASSLPLTATQVLDPNPIASVAIAGTGEFADTPVNPAGSTGGVRITITNLGGAALNIVNASITGANAADFVFVPIPVNPRGAGNIATCSSTVFPVVLGNNSRCGYSIAFSPSAVGLRTATFTMTTNDPANPTVTLNLSGNALPQVFQPTLSQFNVSGLWVNPAEPDWSLSIAHHQKAFVGATESDAVVATFNTFDTNGAPTWYTIKNGSWTGTPSNVVTFSTTYTGEIHQTTGTYFASIFDAAHAIDSVVGTATLSFTDASNGVLSYTINGVSGSKTIAVSAF